MVALNGGDRRISGRQRLVLKILASLLGNGVTYASVFLSLALAMEAELKLGAIKYWIWGAQF